MLSKEQLVYEYLRILKSYAPVRDGVKYPGKRGASEYPGWMKHQGIRIAANGSDILIGGDIAPYALYTETRSKKKNWIKDSTKEFKKMMIAYGGKIING